jgi:mRNA deadenylase 3'-5' endonuclease subunit Ccr4
MLLSRFLANFTTDFICLQEVDMTDWFANELKKNGYDSIAKKRTSNRADHCVLAWKSEEWELLSSEEIEFDQTEHASRDPEYYRRGNVAILGSFRHRTTELPVLVISAHLVASPKYEGTKYA